MNRKQLATRVGLVVAAGALVAFAGQRDARAWVAGASYYEECNVDGHNTGGFMEPDLICLPGEINETYVKGSYKEECYGEGCNNEERYELSEGRSSEAQKFRVHGMMLNSFCVVRSSPNAKGYVRGVHPNHFVGGAPNYTCKNLATIGDSIMDALCDALPGIPLIDCM
jgi:hypothetical protein